VNWTKPSQQISQPVLVEAMEIMDDREYWGRSFEISLS